LVSLALSVDHSFAGDPVGPTVSPPNTSVLSGDEIEVGVSNESRSASWWRTRNHLLGDLGGLRSRLESLGLSLEIESLDEGFALPDHSASDSEGGRYAGLTDVILSLDTEGAGWWQGGQIVIDLQNTRGGDISEVVGDVQGISSIVAPEGTRFAEYFISQEIADGRGRVKIGKQDANADFVVAEGGAEFLNSSFGIIPTVPLPTFPAPALGVMGAWVPSETIRLKAGYWDGAPKLGSGCSTAIFDGSNGTVGALGVEIRPFGHKVLDGTYRIGVWRHSEVEIASTTKAAEAQVGPARGLYFTADQGLWEHGHRRLAAFAQGGWGETDRSSVSRYFGGGLTFSAPFASRPDDMVGLGLAYAALGRLEHELPDCPSETVIELFYRAPITGWLSLNPDIQLVRRPGGSSGTAVVAGLRIATVF
jgi:porin